MNQITVTGVVERVDVKALNEGNTLLTFNLVGAFEEQGKERRFVVPVSLFGNQARRYEKGLEGQEIAVVGSLRQRTWETKEGQKRSAVAVNARYLYAVAHAEKRPFGEAQVPYPAINHAVLQGRLVDAPKSAEKGPVRLTLAVSRDYVPEGKERPDTDFLDVVVWAPLAEAVLQAQKGDPLTVFGRFAQERWKDDKGESRYSERVTATGVVPGVPLVLEPEASP